MKWLLIIGGVLAALVVVMIVIGAMLPVGHRASRSAQFAKAPAEVFAAIEKLAGEQKDVPFDVVERAEPTRLVTKIKPGQPFGGTWTYELKAEGSGSTLTITEDGEVYNPLFRFLSKYAFGHTATLDGFLKQLQSRV
jgi:hypothetical protein